MRFFCLNFQKEIPSYLCDYFYTITPQLFYREPHWIFGDLTKVLHLHTHVTDCEQLILQQLKKSGYQAHLAFGLSPHEAEAKATAAATGSAELQQLPIRSLFDLQGLSPWPDLNEISALIDDLELLGFENLGQIYQAQWSRQDWINRWGQLGSTVYQKLFSDQYDCLIPLYIPESKELRSYKYFQSSIDSIEWLKNELLELLEQSILRLLSTKRLSKKLKIICYHEFDRKKTEWNLQSIKPSTDFKLWSKLVLETLLNAPSLNNPIEEIELLFQIEAFQYSQASLFDHETQFNESKFYTFLSWLKQKGLDFGFLQTQNHPFFEHQSILTYPIKTDHCSSNLQKLALEPTYLLKEPLKLCHQELNTLALHPQISERFDTEEPISYKRHYFLAKNANSQWMWIFYNPEDQGFYMHGYFD